MLELDLAEAEPSDDAALAAARGRYEAAVARFLGVADRGRPADAWLLQTAAAGLALARTGPADGGSAQPDVRRRGGRGRPRVRRQPAGCAAGRAGREPRHPGPGPGSAHRGEGRRGGRHRQGRGHGHRLSRTRRPGSGTRRCGPSWAWRSKHAVELVAIGNGTASRETDKLAAELIKQLPRGSAGQAAEARGLRGRRVGVFGLRAGRGGTAGHGRVPARRGLDRAAAAGPARGAGEDRAEVDRRRAVPARRHRGEAGPQPRRRGGGLRQRGGRGRQHRLAGAAEPGGRRRAAAEREHRGVPERARPVRQAQRAEEGAAARRQGVRTVRGLPADHRGSGAAGCLQRAPRGLSRWRGRSWRPPATGRRRKLLRR